MNPSAASQAAKRCAWFLVNQKHGGQYFYNDVSSREEDIRELVHRAELVVGENQFLKSQLEMKQSIIDNLKNEFLRSKPSEQVV